MQRALTKPLHYVTTRKTDTDVRRILLCAILSQAHRSAVLRWIWVRFVQYEKFFKVLTV
jgi:hypothetical protein